LSTLQRGADEQYRSSIRRKSSLIFFSPFIHCIKILLIPSTLF
jgi:hypothetical protein